MFERCKVLTREQYFKLVVRTYTAGVVSAAAAAVLGYVLGARP